MGAGFFTPHRARLLNSSAADMTGGQLKVILLDMADAGVGGGVTGATNATPIVIATSSAHGLTTGDRVAIQEVGGNTAANGSFQITVTDTTHFSLQDEDGANIAGNGTYTSGGSVMDLELSTYDEVAAAAKVSDAVALASVAVTAGKLTATSPVTITGAAAGEDPVEAVLFFNDTGTPSTSQLVYFKGSDIEQGLPLTPNGENITLTLASPTFRIKG